MGLTTQQFVESLTVHGIMPSGEVTTLLREWTQISGQEPNAEALVRRLVEEGKLTKFQAVNLYQGRGKGLIFGDYVILDKLGAGGMGKVYKAKHRRMNRTVALKVLPPHVSAQPRIVQRFFREVQVAAKLTHPNIVAAYDSGESNGVHYLVMEYVAGSDLSSIAEKDGQLAVARAVDLVRQAAAGLAYAHKQNIVHRDIKPANLLVDGSGTVKILDMGLARITEDDATSTSETQGVLTVEGEVMGTPDYMAPEQSQDTHSADHRADIYALGCTLYRLLAGAVPYPAETTILKIMAHHDRPIPKVADVRNDVPPSVDALLERLMAKKPEDRPQATDDVVAALEGIAREVGSAR